VGLRSPIIGRQHNPPLGEVKLLDLPVAHAPSLPYILQQGARVRLGTDAHQQRLQVRRRFVEEELGVQYVAQTVKGPSNHFHPAFRVQMYRQLDNLW